jgi:hypothetical protein
MIMRLWADGMVCVSVCHFARGKDGQEGRQPHTVWGCGLMAFSSDCIGRCKGKQSSHSSTAYMRDSHSFIRDTCWTLAFFLAFASMFVFKQLSTPSGGHACLPVPPPSPRPYYYQSLHSLHVLSSVCLWGSGGVMGCSVAVPAG